MEARNHHDAVRVDPIEEAMRESVKWRASNLAVKHLAGLWLLGDELRSLGGRS